MRKRLYENALITVVVSGGFDPIHKGHIEHMRLAKQLGDRLVVIVNSDEFLKRKKGYVFMPLDDRMKIIRAIKFVDDAVACIDNDQSVAETIKLIKPNIFAKGGDRIEGNIPKQEVDACDEVGCKIVYGVGGQLSASSELTKTVHEEMSTNDNRLIYFEPAGQILSSHRFLFNNPPIGYKFIVNEDNFGANAHKLLNSTLYKFGVGSLPWHIIKPKIESFSKKPFEDIICTFAWNHIVFRNEPWIVHVEWPEMLTGFSYFWFKQLRALVTKQLASDDCKAIITWSKVSEQSFYTNYPDYKQFMEKIHVIPLAVSSNKKFVRNYNKTEISFLFVSSAIKGREDYNFHMKGGKETLEAFSLVNSHYKDVKLIMISETPVYYVEKFSKNHNICFVGNRVHSENMVKYYSDSDIFLFPGHDTPFGVILEAMSYEMPIITTDVYGNKELVEDGVTGFVIKSSKFAKYFDGTIATRPMTGPKRISKDIMQLDKDVVMELADKMMQLVEDHTLRQRMGVAGRSVVENGIHSVQYRNRKLKEIFDKI